MRAGLMACVGPGDDVECWWHLRLGCRLGRLLVVALGGLYCCLVLGLGRGLCSLQRLR